MNISFLNDMSFRLRIKNAWTEWVKHIRRYPDIVQWWVYCVRRRIKSLFIQGAKRKALCDLLQEPGQQVAKMIKLKKLKTKIIRLNSSYRQRLIDTSDQDRIAGEPPPCTTS